MPSVSLECVLFDGVNCIVQVSHAVHDKARIGMFPRVHEGVSEFGLPLFQVLWQAFHLEPDDSVVLTLICY